MYCERVLLCDFACWTESFPLLDKQSTELILSLILSTSCSILLLTIFLLHFWDFSTLYFLIGLLAREGDG